VLAQATRPRTVTVPEQVIVEAEKVAVERDHLRVVVALKDEQLKAKDEQIGALNGLVTIERARAESWAKAALERKDAIVIDDKRLGLYEADLLRVRTERDKARSNQKFWGAIGLALGVALGVFSQK